MINIDILKEKAGCRDGCYVNRDFSDPVRVWHSPEGDQHETWQPEQIHDFPLEGQYIDRIIEWIRAHHDA